MRKVIGVGETILDIIFKNGRPHVAVPGGSTFNGLVALSRLGVPVTFISEVGNDPVGRLMMTFMESNGLATDYIDRFPNGKSPVSLAFLSDRNDADYLFYQDYPAERLNVPMPEINEDDIFVYGSYYALNPVLRKRMVELLNYAHSRKAILYYDPNFRSPHAHEAIRLMPTILENFEYADIVRGADEDCLHMFNQADTEKAYAEHIRFYCHRFIATHGADGVDLYDKGHIRHYAASSIHPVSTIGAGDNFNAGIIYGLLAKDIRRQDLDHVDETVWKNIIQCGIDLATEVCLSYDNYISKEFANTYATSLK